ncbi:hypothetical protein BDB00DRAFT_830627 [Zychaea mexicana]|uniref:uncharacterized protein n=1 Tax=Zychaea mexicana TaxID=64656 RepID=UPI0022FDB625|nr:uncharacterized protein BDB00DRAFT_830627 [Zychaea mexicana]KAI9491983.1 hypothetical protein BDB00DRAFT_830627 [Zychaea mexicana]
MQFTSFPILLLASASALASPILIERQEQQQAPTYTVSSPAAKDIVIAGHATTISWTPGENTALSIDLASSDASDGINLANDINGSTGSYLVNIPGNIANCSEHKIVIKYNDESTSSEPFYIAADGTETCVSPNSSEESAAPAATLAADELSGATASASIDILDNEGNPIESSESFAIKAPTPITMLSTLVIAGLSCVMMAL